MTGIQDSSWSRRVTSEPLCIHSTLYTLLSTLYSLYSSTLYTVLTLFILDPSPYSHVILLSSYSRCGAGVARVQHMTDIPLGINSIFSSSLFHFLLYFFLLLFFILPVDYSLDFFSSDTGLFLYWAPATLLLCTDRLLPLRPRLFSDAHVNKHFTSRLPTLLRPPL